MNVTLNVSVASGVLSTGHAYDANGDTMTVVMKNMTTSGALTMNTGN
jgi:hypothetical protein